MEVPDKLYAKICHPISDEYTEITAFEDRWDNDVIEYICKDTLLEWAEKKRAQLLAETELTDDVIMGICGGLDLLINKIKSL